MTAVTGRPTPDQAGYESYGGSYLAQITENAKPGELDLETADVARIRKDLNGLGEPISA